MDTLRLTTVQAASADSLIEVAAGALYAADLDLRPVMPRSWRKRLAAFDAGEISICWMCGTQYVWRADSAGPRVRLLACPVPAEAEAQGRPVYFSDVIVGASSSYRDWDSLRGSRLAFNEAQSYSGYWTLRRALEGRRLEEYFGMALAAGSHSTALRWVLAGQADCAAIDCTVLAAELRREPDLARRFRVIRRLGPAPAPPWVASASFPEALFARCQQALLALGEDEATAAKLRAIGYLGFAAVSDGDYAPIRAVLRGSAA